METAQIKEKFLQINDPYKEKQQLYEIMDLLGISYRKTNCKSCIMDYFAICQESLGIIEDASLVSDWDLREYDLIFTYPRPVRWNGKIIKKTSPREVHEAFYSEHPEFYIKQQKIDFK